MTLVEPTKFDQTDDALTQMFEPDTLSLYEYLMNSRRTVPLEPEKHLMHAILEDAIKIFRLHVSTKSGHERRLFLDAQRWIFGPNNNWLFSFENICEALGLNPEFVRSGLLRWKEQQSAPAMVSSPRYQEMRGGAR